MRTKRLIHISYFAMLAVIGSLIRFPVVKEPLLMYTIQAVTAVMAGLILGAKDGAASQLVYLLAGTLGLPIFVGGGGFDYINQPAYGYVFSLFIGAFAAGWLKQRHKTLSHAKLYLCAEAGLFCIYAIAAIYRFLAISYIQKQGNSFALSSISLLPILFIVDSVLLYLFCRFFPKVMSLIGLECPEFIKEEKSVNTVANDKNP